MLIDFSEVLREMLMFSHTSSEEMFRAQHFSYNMHYIEPHHWKHAVNVDFCGFREMIKNITKYC